MSAINPVGGPNPLQRLAPAKSVQHPAPTSPAAATDKVELGNVDHLLNQLKANDIRVDKVQQIKAEIAAGTYETDDKLDAAADKLLDELA